MKDENQTKNAASDGELKKNEVLKISEQPSQNSKNLQTKLKSEKTPKNSKNEENLQKNPQKIEKKEKNDKKMSLKKKIIRSSIVILVVAAICVLGYYILVWTGAWQYMNSQEKVQNLIGSLGFWGYFLFVAIQFLQVTFLPLPSVVSTLAGVYVFGPLKAALLSLAGIFLGSAFAFLLGRIFGRKLVAFMVGEDTCEKWVQFLTDAKYSFFVMMVLPIFPDDVLCLVAGLTNMSWAFFVITNLISRPLAVFTTCYIGSGELIPYHGWGLAVWAVLIVVVLVVIFLSYKYRTQIENFIRRVFRSKSQPNPQTNQQSNPQPNSQQNSSTEGGSSSGQISGRRKNSSSGSGGNQMEKAARFDKKVKNNAENLQKNDKKTLKIEKDDEKSKKMILPKKQKTAKEKGKERNL